ncbi:MAG: family 20 glycosylhydrolase, partial [Candidatus Hodarchaeales archaeon]
DYPRFAWRGFMFDEGRHFHGIKVVKRLLDLLALYKMNKFHWHLTDDQGWRIEIKKYPKLVEIGSKRKRTQTGGIRSFLTRQKSNKTHEGYYTQDEIIEIVDYAKNLFIDVIPEIDIPGHSMAAIASYPEYSCTGGPFEVATTWGIKKDVLCPGKERTFELDQLQDYFIDRVTNFLVKNRRIPMGWNEVLHDDLLPEMIVQHWLKGDKQVEQHLRSGRKFVISRFFYYYLDYDYLMTPLSKTYNFEPIPPTLESEFYQSFKKRLDFHLKRLDLLDVEFANRKEYDPGFIRRIFLPLKLLKDPNSQ